MSRRFALLLLLLAACPKRPETFPGPPPVAVESALPNPVDTTVDQGPRVVLWETPGATVVALEARVGVGTLDETERESGAAHLIEHLLLHPGGRRGEPATALERAGARIEGVTAYRETLFRVVAPARLAPEALAFLHETIFVWQGDEGALDAARRAVTDEIRSGAQDPARAVTQALFTSAFAGHSYARSVLGNEELLGALSLDDLRRFHERWYVPRNVTLVAVGGFSREAALATLREDWTGGKKAPDRARGELPALDGPRVALVTRRVSSARVAAGFSAPASPELSLLAAVCARRAQVDSAYVFAPGEGGFFVIHGGLPGQKPEVELRAWLAGLYRMRHELVSPDEIAAARADLLAARAFARETPEGLARALARPDLEVPDGVTPEALRELAARVLSPEAMALSLLVHPARADESLAPRLAELAEAEWKSVAERFAPREVTPDAHGVITRVLGSGVTVLVKPDPTVSVVALSAAWPGGLRAETPASNGASVLLARLLPRGGAGRSPDRLRAELEGLGGRYTGAAGRDTLVLSMEVTGGGWLRGLELLAASIHAPRLSESAVVEERRRLLAERATEPYDGGAEVFGLFAETLFGGHPYALPLAGTVTSVSGLSGERLTNHYRRLYPLSRLVIAVVGNVEPAEVLAKAEALFGRAGPTGEEVKPAVPAPPDALREVYRFVDAESTHVLVGFRGVLATAEEREALDVVAQLMRSALRKDMERRSDLAFGLSAFAHAGLDPGFFAVYAQTTPERASDVVALVRRRVEILAGHRLPASVVRQAAESVAGAHEMELRRPQRAAEAMAVAEATGAGQASVWTRGTRLLSVTPSDVQQVAAAFLRWDRAVLATVGPQSFTPAAEDRARGTVKKPPPPRKR